LDDFLTKLEEGNPNWFKREGNIVHATFEFLDGCVCPIIRKTPYDASSGTWCLCSAGLHKTFFEETLGRPVEVVFKNRDEPAQTAVSSGSYYENQKSKASMPQEQYDPENAGDSLK